MNQLVTAQQSFASLMSMSKSAASDSMKTQVLEFLRELQRDGMLESMVSSVRQEAAQMPCRLPDGPDLEDDEEFQHIASDEMPLSLPGSEGPIMPRQSHLKVFQMGTSEGVDASKISLPDRVSSLEEWGRTVCELPKVKNLSRSYHELRLDSENGDVQLSKYLSWIRAYKGSSSRSLDFKKYLLACDACAAVPKTYFPGTMEVRRLK